MGEAYWEDWAAKLLYGGLWETSMGVFDNIGCLAWDASMGVLGRIDFLSCPARNRIRNAIPLVEMPSSTIILRAGEITVGKFCSWYCSKLRPSMTSSESSLF